MNNNRFRFRVWSPFAKKYFNDLDILLKPNGEALISVLFAGDEKKEYIIESCTGLKDKNGKMIFEGDVIRHTNGYLYNVKYDEENCSFYAQITDNDIFSFYDPHDFIGMEIVSNIHEENKNV